MMIGFAEQRRMLLETEFVRFVEDLPPLGVEWVYVSGDFGEHLVRSDTPLEVVIVHQTEEPWRRRSDFSSIICGRLREDHGGLLLAVVNCRAPANKHCCV
jgi:hypothetical protein